MAGMRAFYVSSCDPRMRQGSPKSRMHPTSRQLIDAVAPLPFYRAPLHVGVRAHSSVVRLQLTRPTTPQPSIE